MRLQLRQLRAYRRTRPARSSACREPEPTPPRRSQAEAPSVKSRSIRARAARHRSGSRAAPRQIAGLPVCSWRSFGRSAANVTRAIRPYGARSSRAGTWEYLEAQAASSSDPQTANAYCIRTGRTELLLNILAHMGWGWRQRGQDTRHWPVHARRHRKSLHRSAAHLQVLMPVCVEGRYAARWRETTAG